MAITNTLIIRVLLRIYSREIAGYYNHRDSHKLEISESHHVSRDVTMDMKRDTSKHHTETCAGVELILPPTELPSGAPSIRTESTSKFWDVPGGIAGGVVSESGIWRSMTDMSRSCFLSSSGTCAAANLECISWNCATWSPSPST